MQLMQFLSGCQRFAGNVLPALLVFLCSETLADLSGETRIRAREFYLIIGLKLSNPVRGGHYLMNCLVFP
jgi:hypothetical protein